MARRSAACSRSWVIQSRGSSTSRPFHDYLNSARFSDEIYDEVARALTGPFSGLPLLTIFGLRNDPLGFQPQWRRLFSECRQETIPAGNHFPMCDDPELVTELIHAWHHDSFSVLKEAQR